MSEAPPIVDPKAQAAADKAYAKAQRPWYKKKRWIISLAVVAIIVISAVASGGGGQKAAQNAGQNAGADHQANAPVTNSQKEQSAKADAGKAGALTWGNWEVVGKLQVSKEEYTHDFKVVTRVRNTSKSPDEGLFTVTILKGEEILGTADCSTATIQPGAVGTADCSSMDKFQPGYTEVTIEDAF